MNNVQAASERITEASTTTAPSRVDVVRLAIGACR
jgi:hypothetical protein